jgi:anti-sigma factor (TIGR02949 family)
MRCDEALDLIEPLLDNELDPSAAEDLRRHLDACPSCADDAEAGRQLLDELRSLPEIDAPRRVVERVRELADRESVRRRDRTGGISRLGWLAAAAALVLALGAATIGRQHAARADAEARRAAADLTCALACLSDITQRANRAIQTEVIDHRIVPVAARGLARPLQRIANGISQGESPVTPRGIRNEGNS